MTRAVDVEATKVARTRQGAAEERLQIYFGLPYWLARFRRLGTPVRASLDGFVFDGPPVRGKASCPRLRTAAMKRRHLARKRQHAARRYSW